MADILSNTTNLTNLVPTYYSKRLLERLEPNCRAYQLAEKRKLPANMGKTILWNRYVQLGAGMALTEGVSPGPSALSTVTVSATLVQYGNLVRITDLVEETAISNVVKDAVDVLGDNAALTIDKYILDTIGFYGSAIGALSACSAAILSYQFPVLYSKTSGSLDGETWLSNNYLNASAMVSLPMSVSAIRKTVTHLRKLSVSPHEDGFYHALIHPTAIDALRGHTDYISWNRHTGSPVEQFTGNKLNYMLGHLETFITEGVKIWKPVRQSAGKILRPLGSQDYLTGKVQLDCTPSREQMVRIRALSSV